MNVQRLVLSIILFVLIGASASAVPVHAATRAEFDQAVAELQKKPDDQDLRKKIIRLALALNPMPEVPEEAYRRMARGRAAVKGAKDLVGFRGAFMEFEKAALAAPWLPEAYYNLGVVSDKAGNYAAAVNSLNLCLLADPVAPNAQKVKSLLQEIEGRSDKAAEEERKAKEGEAAIDEIRRREKSRYYNSKCFQPGWKEIANAGGNPEGCNESEYSGRNWVMFGKADGKFIFPDRRTVILDAWCCRLIGTPNGPKVSDIVWRQSKTEGGKVVPTGAPVWVKHDAYFTVITCSDDRPVDKSRFDPNVRYDYCMVREEK